MDRGCREVPPVLEFLRHTCEIWLEAVIIHYSITDMPKDESRAMVDVEEATAVGRQRLTNMACFDAPVLLPRAPSWAFDVKATAQHQLATAVDVEALVGRYVELMKTAKELVDFWQSNVGPTDDWPLAVVGDSAMAEDLLEGRVAKLALVVAFVEESS